MEKVIFAISDIHTEFYESAQEVFDIIPWQPATHLVLSGDIGVVSRKKDIYTDFLIRCKSKYKNVMVIPGNHEYYGCNYDRNGVEEFMMNLCEKIGVHYIHKRNVVIDGIRFIGHTMWSMIEKYACPLVNDFSQQVFRSRDEYLSAHRDGYEFFKKEIENSRSFPEPIVIVTHHLPSTKLIHPKYKNSAINSAFASDVSSFIDLTNVKYWFCGHTHEYVELTCDKTRIIANPFGYPGEKRSTQLCINTHVV
jgi:Icc-related predicted phosphoesterase